MTSRGLTHAFGANAGGIAAMLLSCALFVIGDSCVKAIGLALPLGELITLRGLIAVPIIYLVARRAGVLHDLPRVLRNPRVQVRCLLEVGCTFLFLAGLIRMTYADAIAIQQFVPLAVMAGAALFLGDEVGWRRWIAAGVGLIGVMIVARPGSGAFNWASLLIVANVMCVAARDLLTRRLGEAIPTALIALPALTVVSLAGLAFIPFEGAWRVPTPREVALISVSALCSVGGFYFVAEALRRGEVSAIIPFRYSLIPYGVISGLVVFGEVPDLLTIVGSIIVLGAGLYALNRERLRAAEKRETAAADERAARVSPGGPGPLP